MHPVALKVLPVPLVCARLPMMHALKVSRECAAARGTKCRYAGPSGHCAPPPCTRTAPPYCPDCRRSCVRTQQHARAAAPAIRRVPRAARRKEARGLWRGRVVPRIVGACVPPLWVPDARCGGGQAGKGVAVVALELSHACTNARARVARHAHTSIEPRKPLFCTPGSAQSGGALWTASKLHPIIVTPHLSHLGSASR